MPEPPPSAAIERAVRLLGRRAMSARELIDTLVRQGTGTEEAEATVAEMIRRGWVDDRAYAETLCRGILRRGPAAAVLLEARLRRRGIDSETAAESIADALGHADPVEAALDLARRQLATMGRVDRAAALRRVAGRLARRGFDDDTVGAVVERLGLDDSGPP